MDVSFSAGEVALVTALLGFVCTPLGAMYLSLRKTWEERHREDQAEIARLQASEKELRNALLESVKTAGRATSLAERSGP